MKNITSIAALVLICGFCILLCVPKTTAFPGPAAGHVESAPHYDFRQPLNPIVVALKDSIAHSETELQLPSTGQLIGHDGICFVGEVRNVEAESSTAVAFVELSRRYKQTKQILASNSDVFEVKDGRIAITIATSIPRCAGDIEVSISLLPLTAMGEPIRDEPKLISKGTMGR